MRELEVTDISDGSEYANNMQLRWALQYMSDSYEESRIRKHKEDLRNLIRSWMFTNCYQDEDGNYLWDFDKPIMYDEDTIVSGMMLQKRSTESINPDLAWELMLKHNGESRCIVTVEELDIDQLYAMNAEGVISDEEFDTIFDTEESYSLVRIKQ